jgi:hypothetical protein
VRKTTRTAGESAINLAPDVSHSTKPAPFIDRNHLLWVARHAISFSGKWRDIRRVFVRASGAPSVRIVGAPIRVIAEQPFR